MDHYEEILNKTSKSVPGQDKIRYNALKNCLNLLCNLLYSNSTCSNCSNYMKRVKSQSFTQAEKNKKKLTTTD